MRDTEVLRRRLWAQIGLPLATVAALGGCDGSANRTGTQGATKQAPEQNKAGPTAIDEGPAEKADDGADAEAETEGAASNAPVFPAGPVGYVPPMQLDQIPEGEFDYFGPARDPFGDHEEEEGCPNGDWCGTPAEARLFAIEHIPDQLGCPAKIIANGKAAAELDQKSKRWKGFSFHPMMQGRLMSSVTKATREEKGNQELCCYHWFEYCSGRPLLDGERMVVAELIPGSSWSCDPAEVAATPELPDEDMPEALRVRVGELWIEDARMEHAAIGAFMRSTLELMAMAAPSDLLGELQEAAQDEVEHAQRCFGLAARFSGLAREPGALPTLEPRVGDIEAEADWVRLAVDTFVEGCVGETIAASIARVSAASAKDPAAREALEAIAEDESRHAAFSWRLVRWAIEVGGAEIRAAVAEALAAAVERPAQPRPVPAGIDREAWIAHGRLSAEVEAAVIRDSIREVVVPCAGALLGAPPAARVELSA
ncbi:MAG: ferritin-like domain-containing protein [Myxococcales bacterium]|nr:ferritin-like domain-containing protein [Myxococcales bacterium]